MPGFASPAYDFISISATPAQGLAVCRSSWKPDFHGLLWAGGAAFSCRPLLWLNFGGAGGCCSSSCSVNSWLCSLSSPKQWHSRHTLVGLLCTHETLALKTWSCSWMRFHPLVVKMSLGILLLCQWDKPAVLGGYSFSSLLS